MTTNLHVSHNGKQLFQEKNHHVIHGFVESRVTQWISYGIHLHGINVNLIELM